MIQILPEQFENILLLAVEWVEVKEKVNLEHGTALSPQYNDLVIRSGCRQFIFFTLRQSYLA